MGKFPEAQEAAGRAIALLEPGGGPNLAAAYGTRGLIFRDSKQDREAAEWLGKACREHQKLPSPNLETLAEDLENLAAALERLGRADEAAVAWSQLESAKAARQVGPQAGPDLGNLNAPMGAVSVELNSGSYAGDETGARDARQLGQQLMGLVRDANAGSYGGHVVLPESTVLMFYGEDAERLFELMQPTLANHSLCAGARVTIRQETSHREVMVPGRVM